MGGRRDTYTVSMEKPEGKKQLGRSRHKWEDNIKLCFQEMKWTELMWLRIGTGNGRLSMR
jgi:hypothetical protein